MLEGLFGLFIGSVGGFLGCLILVLWAVTRSDEDVFEVARDLGEKLVARVKHRQLLPLPPKQSADCPLCTDTFHHRCALKEFAAPRPTLLPFDGSAVFARVSFGTSIDSSAQMYKLSVVGNMLLISSVSTQASGAASSQSFSRVHGGKPAAVTARNPRSAVGSGSWLRTPWSKPLPRLCTASRAQTDSSDAYLASDGDSASPPDAPAGSSAPKKDAVTDVHAAWWVREAAEPLATGAPVFAIVLDFAAVEVERTPIPGVDRFVLHSRWHVKNHLLLTVPTASSVRAAGDEPLPTSWVMGSKGPKLPHHERCPVSRRPRQRATTVAHDSTTAAHPQAQNEGKSVRAGSFSQGAPSTHGSAGVGGSMGRGGSLTAEDGSLRGGGGTPPAGGGGRARTSTAPALPCPAQAVASRLIPGVEHRSRTERGEDFLAAMPSPNPCVGDASGATCLVDAHGHHHHRVEQRGDPSITAYGDAPPHSGPKYSHAPPAVLTSTSAPVPCDGCARTVSIHCSVPREMERLFVRLRAGALLRGRLDLHDAAVHSHNAAAKLAARAEAADVGAISGGGGGGGGGRGGTSFGSDGSSGHPRGGGATDEVDGVAPSAPIRVGAHGNAASARGVAPAPAAAPLSSEAQQQQDEAESPEGEVELAGLGGVGGGTAGAVVRSARQPRVPPGLRTDLKVRVTTSSGSPFEVPPVTSLLLSPRSMAQAALRAANAPVSACAVRAAAQVSSWVDYIANGPLRPELRKVLWGDPGMRVCGCFMPGHPASEGGDAEGPSFTFCRSCGMLIPPGSYADDTLRRFDPYLMSTAFITDSSVPRSQFAADVAAAAVGSLGTSQYSALGGAGAQSLGSFNTPPPQVGDSFQSARNRVLRVASAAALSGTSGGAGRVRASTPPRAGGTAPMSGMVPVAQYGHAAGEARGHKDSGREKDGKKHHGRGLLGAIDTLIHKVAHQPPAVTAGSPAASHVKGGGDGRRGDAPRADVAPSVKYDRAYGAGAWHHMQRHTVSERCGVLMGHPSVGQGGGFNSMASVASRPDASGGGDGDGDGEGSEGRGASPAEVPSFLKQSGAAALGAVNVLLSRMMWDFFRDPHLTEFMRDEINLKLSLLPKVLGLVVPTVRCVALNLGGCVPHITQIGWPYIGPDGTVSVEVSGKWAGGASAAFAVSLSAPGFSAQVAIGVVVRLGAVEAEARIEISPPPARHFWAGFITPPALDIEAEVEAGTVGDRLLNRFPTLIDTLVGKIKDRLLASMVLPNYEDFPIPKFPESKARKTHDDSSSSSSESSDDEVAQLIEHLRGHEDE